MKTSYREISNTDFEVSVISDEDGTIVIGIISSSQYGKWSSIHEYFPVPSFLSDTVKNKDSMVECGRNLVTAWQKFGAQQRFDEKLKQIRLTEQKAAIQKQKEIDDHDDQYFDDLWDLSTYDPFEGEP